MNVNKRWSGMGNLFYSWICGFPNIQYFLVSLTESTGCLSSGIEQCCCHMWFFI